MIYVEHIPNYPLKPWINKLWYCKANHSTNQVTTVPLLHHELVFKFSGLHHLFRAKSTSTFAAQHQAWISGMHTRSHSSISQGSHEKLGVLFNPVGLKAFTSCWTHDFENEFVEAELIFGSVLKELTDQVIAQSTIELKFGIIEGFLKMRLRDYNLPRYLTPAVQQLGDTVEKPSISSICKELSITNKSLIQAFDQYLGTSPVKFQRLILINSAIRAMAHSPSVSLTQLAYELGFTDQSHFTHSFKTTTGLTPSQYAQAVKNGLTEASAPNFVATTG